MEFEVFHFPDDPADSSSCGRRLYAYPDEWSADRAGQGNATTLG